MTEIRSNRRRIDYLQKAIDRLQQQMDALVAGVENENPVDLITMVDESGEFITEKDYDEEQDFFINDDE